MNEEKRTIAQRLEDSKQRSEMLSATIKELLLYVGAASAVIGSLSYIIITIVMVKGFTTDLELANQIVFAVIGAIVGVFITISLIMQGVAFAKQDTVAQDTMNEYYKVLNKTKKEKDLHTIDHYIFWAIIKTVIIKGITVAVSSFFILYIFIEGNGNWSLLGLAFANIFMFIGFGLVGLSNAYDYYLKQHIPVIKELTSKLSQEKEKGESTPLVLNEEVEETEIVCRDLFKEKA